MTTGVGYGSAHIGIAAVNNTGITAGVRQPSRIGQAIGIIDTGVAVSVGYGSGNFRTFSTAIVNDNVA